MNTTPKVMGYRDFMNLLREGKGEVRGPINVTDNVSIDCAELELERLCIEGVVFHGMPIVRGLSGENACVTLEKCHFLDGLTVEHMKGRHLWVKESHMKGLWFSD